MSKLRQYAQIAKECSLRYITPTGRGLTRKKYGKGFAYFTSNNTKIEDAKVLERIKSLKIPPAYRDVWICPFDNGHIQAIGYDEKGRKQYIYHPEWTKIRQEQKFDSLLEFGQFLPTIRKHVEKTLISKPDLNKSQVVCTILYLLDSACIRIGTPLYAKKNKSYGLTTLRKKHLLIEKNKVFLKFSGKSGQLWHVNLDDSKIIKILKKCAREPGYELFKYRDAQNHLTLVTSQEVNEYIQNHTKIKNTFTTKDFRTWTACREIFYHLVFMEQNRNSKHYPAARLLKMIIDRVAHLLGHTSAVCQKHYIDPEIIYWWKNKSLYRWCRQNHMSIQHLNKDELFLFWLKSK